MALKGQPIAVGTTDTTVYTCPATLEGSVHGLVFSNVTGSAATITIKMYIQSTGVTTTVATGISVAANSTYTWPKPVDVNAGDIIKASANTISAIVCVYSAYENAATPAATGFTPRGAWSSVASYVKNDTVSYTNGNSYVAIQASTNQQPDTQTAYWQLLAERGASGAGDVTGPASSVANEIVLFDGSTGKLIKSATTTGIVKATSGVIGAATAGTDYVAPGGALGTPSSGTLTNCTGLPISTGVSNLGANVATFLATPSSANLAAAVTDETGSGSLVFATSPSFTTPTLGVASATSVNKVTLTAPATGSTLTIADGKTLTASNTLTFTGTDSSSVAFGTGGTVAYTGGTLAQFASTTSSQLAGVISDETGSGSLVFGTSPTMTTPRIAGSSTGYTSLASANSSATNYTVTFPAETMTVGFRNVPAVGTKTGSYTLALPDIGKYVQLGSGGSITIPDATFAEGDIVSVFNNTSGAITITCTITTAYIAGTDSDKATVSLATRGVATILFISGTVCVISGNVS